MAPGEGRKGEPATVIRCLSMLAVLLVSGSFVARAAAQDRFPTDVPDVNLFLHDLWPDAQSQGIGRATFDAAFNGLAADRRVLAATLKQPEYGKPAGDYVNAIASKARAEDGLRKAMQWSKTFDAVEQEFAVERWILLGIWGIESSYGADNDHWDVVRSLLTLAAAHYRDPYFRNELLVVLKMMQEDHISRDKLIGSWAGAMGQPQFMPSDFVKYAVAFSGKGRGDIWTSVPDVLASTANYLHKEGWVDGLRWGFEVVVPGGFDYRRSRGAFSDWAVLGMKRADGAPLPAAGSANLFFPSGAAGPAFLVTRNFDVIKTYNNSDIYALAVGHLADRLHGFGPIRAAWPAGDHQLSRDERINLQHKLADLGYRVSDFEGHFDFELRDAIRDVQEKSGLVPDGQPTPVLLDRLGATGR
jgi:membrane-bound lytic murein transglycosylase B